MNFIAAKAAIVQLLKDYADGRYRVVDFSPMPTDAKDFQGNNRTVRCFYDGGEFPMESLSTPAKHEIKMMLELVVTASSETDLGVFNDPNSTEAQRATAMVGTTPAALIADSDWDIFASILWNGLMEPKNRWLGMTKNVVGSRWISSMKKDRLIPVGEQCILTGYIVLEFNLEEESDGDIPYTFDHNNTEFSPIDGDEVQKTAQKT